MLSEFLENVLGKEINNISRIKNLMELINGFLNDDEFIEEDTYLSDVQFDQLVNLNNKLTTALISTPNNDLLRAKSWAVLQEIMYRTTNITPNNQDVAAVLAAELVNAEVGHAVYHLPKREAAVAGTFLNNNIILLVILRRLSQPNRTVDIIDHYFSEKKYNLNHHYNVILGKAEPYLNCLNIDKSSVKSKVCWYTRNDPEALNKVSHYRGLEALDENSDTEDFQLN